ncbi:Wax ester synthase/diacylglycerol acyltransferase 10 [Cardamine amara subsp. amara]|uniref:diacylglycerol O-acyltransferase n=1 Tax=Cardamine amara subsp. amara TaxID=228776 RepID=A0ABD1ATI9_CARAN
MAKEEEEQPLSPMARVFQSQGIDSCIVTIIGFKTKINADIIVEVLKHNVSKHPRFSSKLGDDGRNWIKTKVNIEDHVVVPNVNLEEIGEDGDGFVNDYVSRLTMIPLDRSKPLWDIHILNVKTSDAEAITVIRSHHSLGDGMSLMSLLVASTRKTSDPATTPTITALKRRGTTSSLGLKKKDWFMKLVFFICNTLRLIWNTVVDLLLILATMLFLKDTETPLHCHTEMDSGSNLRRFYHRTVSLDDIKLIKKAMNMTINDVLLGVTQAASSFPLYELPIW